MGRWEKNSEGKQSNTAAHNLRLVYFCTKLKLVFTSQVFFVASSGTMLELEGNLASMDS